MSQFIKIAVGRADGGVSIVAFVIAGRGNLLPSGAVWLDEKSGTWSRPPSDESVAEEVKRAVPDAVSWQLILDDEVPQDRTFRNALTLKNGALMHDVDKARLLTRDIIRHKRAAVLPDLDAQWMRATGQGKKADADKIERERQMWRDAPADPRIDAARTIEQLKPLLPG